MAINRTNYEAYLIDYLEGNLSATDQNMVRAFLLSNPDIQEEMDGLSQTVLPSMEDELENRHTLYWNNELDSTTVLMLEAMDGPISTEQQAQLDSVLLDETARKTYQLLCSTVLKPNDDSFPLKEALRIQTVLNYASVEMADTPILSPVLMPYEAKDALLMPAEVDFNDPQMVAAALAEGDAAPPEAVQRVSSLAQLDELVGSLKSMRLQSRAVTFDDKKSLKRKETKVIVFAPLVKRALAVAAVLVFGLTIWCPWETELKLATTVASIQEEAQNIANDSLNAPQAGSISAHEANAFEQAQTTPGNEVKREVMLVIPNDNSVVERISPKDSKEVEQNKKVLPIITEELQDEMAEQKPEASPVLNNSTPSSKGKDVFKPHTGEPVTLLAFIGDKLEDKFEQSPIYSYIERKKQQVFGSTDGGESLRYERVSKADRIKQKLVLWGIEIERSKRKR
jgi:hypothetical protein